MTPELVEELQTELEEAGYRARTRMYSGRGMFGEETHAIVSDAEPRTVLDMTHRRIRWDNMGLDYVYY